MVSTYVKRLLVLVLLLVDYAETEIYLMSLVKVGVHGHDLRECFLCMVQRAIAIIKNTYAIPKPRFLQSTDS